MCLLSTLSCLSCPGGALLQTDGPAEEAFAGLFLLAAVLKAPQRLLEGIAADLLVPWSPPNHHLVMGECEYINYATVNVDVQISL